MELGRLLKEVDGFQASTRNRITDRLRLMAQALATLRKGEIKSECRMAAYLTCLEILAQDTVRRIEIPDKK